MIELLTQYTLVAPFGAKCMDNVVSGNVLVTNGTKPLGEAVSCGGGGGGGGGWRGVGVGVGGWGGGGEGEPFRSLNRLPLHLNVI